MVLISLEILFKKFTYKRTKYLLKGPTSLCLRGSWVVRKPLQGRSVHVRLYVRHQSVKASSTGNSLFVLCLDVLAEYSLSEDL